MSEATSSGVKLLAWVWAVLLALASLAFGVGVAAQGTLSVDAVVNLGAALVYAALGLLMVVRQPGNRVAWLFYVVATWEVLNGATILRLGDQSIPPNPVDVWDVLAIAWSNAGYFVGFLFPLFLFFYLFPTGRFLTRRWSWAGWTAGLLGSLILIVEVFKKEIGLDTGWVVANPFGFLNVAGVDEGLLGAVFGVGFVAMALGGIPAIIVRYRRSETQVRTQIKWVVFALLIVAASLIVIFFIPNPPDWISSLLFFVMLTAVPISITFAITRFQLYEIDRIISRTVTYAFVAGTLAAIYLGLITLITSLLPTENALAVAGSTLAVAALFNPLRRRVQQFVDRRFNRSAYRAEVISEQFAAKLREALTVEELSDLWQQTGTESFQPHAVGIWLNLEYTQTSRP